MSNQFISTYLYAQAFRHFLQFYHPDIIIAESAFSYRFPAVYRSLSLSLHTLRQVSYEFNQKDIVEIAPKAIKKTFSLNGNATKDQVKTELMKTQDLINKDLINFDNITEHEIDSIAIALAFKKIYLTD